MLAPGTLFANDYRIERPLAEGGMGAVFVAEQLSTGKKRALKVMQPSLLADVKSRDRFVQEAKIGAKIDSNNVVEVIGAGIDPSGMPWLAMELLEGETLAHILRTRAPLTPPEVLEIFRQLTHALSRAHDAGIVHRDLKPENIFLAKPRRDGIPFDVKVLDFGIAKVLADAGTRSTRPIGTPLFMAPEQMRPGRAIGPPTDVWALGLIAFACLTGRVYWLAAYGDDSSPMMVLNEVAHLAMPTASQRAEELQATAPPAGFDAWFAEATARAVDERFPDARTAFARLEPVLIGTGETVAPAPATAALRTPSEQSTRKKRDELILAGEGERGTPDAREGNRLATVTTGKPYAIANRAPVAPEKGGGGARSLTFLLLAAGVGVLLWLAFTRVSGSSPPSPTQQVAAQPPPPVTSDPIATTATAAVTATPATTSKVAVAAPLGPPPGTTAHARSKAAPTAKPTAAPLATPPTTPTAAPKLPPVTPPVTPPATPPKPPKSDPDDPFG
jgi:serine/threonine protein kinase